MIQYQLIEAKSNGGSDILLTRDGKVISRWPEITDGDLSDLSNWDDQVAAGVDLSGYQADLDAGRFEVAVLAAETVLAYTPGFSGAIRKVIR